MRELNREGEYSHMTSMSFKGMDIISISDLTKDQIEEILNLANKMIPYAKGEKTTKALEGRILANLFFEPSTRTRLSFESAMIRLGGSNIGITDQQNSSVAKGETLADTIRTVECYADAIVLRHPKEGAARLAAKFSEKPVINCGDGPGQHPTQTLVDLFTMRREQGSMKDKNVVLVGDLKYGRTVHSLVEALALFEANLTFVAPDILQIPQESVKLLEKAGISINLESSLENAIADADVLYVTRIQKERFPDQSEYEKVAGSYKVDNTVLREAKKSLTIMHPLPRVDEIAPEVDYTENAKYFKQTFNAVPIRMAILSLIIGGQV